MFAHRIRPAHMIQLSAAPCNYLRSNMSMACCLSLTLEDYGALSAASGRRHPPGDWREELLWF